MGHPISMEQLRLDVGHMVEKMTQITIMFRRIKLKMEEYVCLKVYILLNKGNYTHRTTFCNKLTPFYLTQQNRGRTGEHTGAVCASAAQLSAAHRSS